MKNLNEFLYGEDYSKKIDLFNKNIEEIHKNYDGDFDTNGYFTLLPHNKSDEIRLVFDQDKDIPVELKSRVQTEFNNIWK